MWQSIEVIGFGVGTTELLIILAIFVFVFGASRIPELGRSLGSGIRGFQKAIKGEDEKKLIEGGSTNEANPSHTAASSASDVHLAQPQREDGKHESAGGSTPPSSTSP
jgi:sec-independent protein translocase protein TatA